LVKDDEGNIHELMLENALVVQSPGLLQNLTSHKQFVENGQMVFFHKVNQELYSTSSQELDQTML
jgi:hypothetical protein